MGSAAQKKAVQASRARQAQKGIARFEVVAPDADRELFRMLARRLVEAGPDADQVRSAVRAAVAGEPPRVGGILAALRRSPLVGADLDLRRAREEGRAIDL